VPDALWAGALAGYAIAVPVGPIAILIVDAGLRRGFWVAAAAGAGAASADGFYATLAGLVGAAIASALTPVIMPARLLGAALLGVIALRGLAAAARSAGRPSPTGPAAAGSAAAGSAADVRALDWAAGAATRRGGDPARTYLLFLGLTIVNPLTFLYFGALMLGLRAVGDSGEKLLFAAGAFGASLSWQLLLAAAGSILHGRLPARLQAATRVVGSLMVLGFAVRLAVAAA